MGLGWYLLKRSYRQHAARLWLVVTAVAIGVALLLSLLAGINGLFHRGDHYVWRTAVSDTKSQQPRPGIAPLLMLQDTMSDLNMWQNETIVVTSVRATGATSPQIPGISTPGQNEYYASPRLAELIKTSPASALVDRFQGKMIGIMPDSLVNSPDSLEIVRGMSEQEAQVAQLRNSFVTKSVYAVPDGTVNPYNGFALIMLFIGAFGLLFPVVKFMASATRLGSLQREQRYAALRLVGATRRQVRAIAAVESVCTTVAGIILGAAMFGLALPLLEGFRFNGERFYASEMQITIPQYLIIVTLTLSAALTANWWGMRRVQNSPLGVVRTQRQKSVPHWLRLVPLGLGVACLAVIQTIGKVTLHRMVREGRGLPLLIFFAAFIFIVVGLMVAGPVLTRMTAALVARYSRQAPSIIATKRIAALSRQTFAGVSGVVLALFVGTFYITATSGVGKLRAEALGNNGYSQLHANVVLVGLGVMGLYNSQQVQREIEALPHITKVVVLSDTKDQSGNVISCQDAKYFTTIRCTQASGQISVNLGDKVLGAPVNTYLTADNITAQTSVLLVATSDPSDTALDSIRAIMSRTSGSLSYGDSYVESGKYAQKPVINPIIEELAGLAYVGIAITMLIAAGGLIVSTISGLLERKRSLLTLRLSGMTVGQLKRLVQIESVVPLIAASVVSAILGVGVAKTFMDIATSALTTVLPDWRYYVIVSACLVLAFAGITGVLAGLDRMTSFEENRAE